MTVDQVYRICLYAVSKNTSQGYLSPDDFNSTINLAQYSYLDYLLGEYQKYMPGRPNAPVNFSQNQRLRTSIEPLIYGTVLNIDSNTGVADYPSDFEQVDAMWSVYNHYRIRFIQQDRKWLVARSTIDPVAENPIYTMAQVGFEFLPVTLGNARMSYVRTPPPITWGYNLDGNGIPVYNSALSQQPVWSDVDMLNVIVRALALVGVNLQFQIVMEYANIIKNGGQ